MRIVCLKEALFNPTRFFLVVWDAAAGCFVPDVEWIVHASDNKQAAAARIQAAIKYFSSKQCAGVTDEVAAIFTQCGISLPAGWNSYQTRK